MCLLSLFVPPVVDGRGGERKCISFWGYVTDVRRFALCVISAVLGQQTQILPQEAFPGIYKDYLQLMYALRFNMIHSLGLQCLISGRASDPPVEESLGLTFFELEFVLIASTFILICLPIGLLATWNIIKMSRAHLMAISLQAAGKINWRRSRTRGHRKRSRSLTVEHIHQPPIRDQGQEEGAADFWPPADAEPSTIADAVASGAMWQMNVAYASSDPGTAAVPVALPATAASADDSSDATALQNKKPPSLSIQTNSIVQWVEGPSQRGGDVNVDAELEQDLVPERISPGTDLERHLAPSDDLNAATVPSGGDRPGGSRGQSADPGQVNETRKKELRKKSSMKQAEPASMNQEVMVVAYCSVATFLLVLIHPVVATAAFQVFFCDSMHWKNVEPTYWLHLGRARQCYVGPWNYIATISAILIITFVFGMPIGLIFVTHFYHRRKQVMLHGTPFFIPGSSIQIQTLEGEAAHGGGEVSDQECDSGITFKVPHGRKGELVTVQPVFCWGEERSGDVDKFQNQLNDKSVAVYLGPYVRPWKEKYFYWQGCDVLLRLSYTGMVILVKQHTAQYELVFTCVMSIIALTLQAYCRPFNDRQLNEVQVLVGLVYALSNCGYMAQYYILASDHNSESIMLGIGLLGMQYGLVGIMCIRIVQYVRDYCDDDTPAHGRSTYDGVKALSAKLDDE
eukprot:gene2874-3675_t